MNYTAKIVEELKKKHIIEDMAARFFIEIFEGEEDDTRMDEYLGLADEVLRTECNGYIVAVFSDDSVYDDTQQGIDRFFPSSADWFQFYDCDKNRVPCLPSALNI